MAIVNFVRVCLDAKASHSLCECNSYVSECISNMKGHVLVQSISSTTCPLSMVLFQMHSHVSSAFKVIEVSKEIPI